MITVAEDSTGTMPTFLRERQFEFDAPLMNMFLPSPTLWFIQETGSLVLRWGSDLPSPAAVQSHEKILDDILRRATRDSERFPLSARAHGNLGLALINRGDLDRAIAAFERALSIEPEHYVSLLNLARVHVAQGNFEQARHLYERLRSFSPKDPSPLLGLAHLAMRSRRFEEAIDYLQEVVRVDRNSVLARYNLGIAYLVLGKANKAISHLRIGTSTAVRLPAIHHALGVAYAISNQPRRAVRSFRAALSLDPTLREAVHGLSKVLIGVKDIETATQILISYLEKRPDDFDARETLALAYKEDRKFSAARGQLLQVLEALGAGKSVREGIVEDGQTKESRVRNNVGALYAIEGNLKEAETWFKRAIDLLPEGSRFAYENLGRLYLQMDRVEDANRILEMANARFPGHEELQHLLADCYERQSQYQEAARILYGLTRSSSPSAKTYGMLGGLLSDSARNFSEARTVLELGRQLFPNDLIIANNLAYTCLMQADVDSARAILASPLLATSTNLYVTCTKGLLRFWEGDIAGGTALYAEGARRAKQEGRWRLASVAEQKMHLELARAYARNHDIASAVREVSLGLKVKGGKSIYQDDLESLEKRLNDEIEDTIN